MKKIFLVLSLAAVFTAEIKADPDAQSIFVTNWSASCPATSSSGWPYVQYDPAEFWSPYGIAGNCFYCPTGSTLLYENNDSVPHCKGACNGNNDCTNQAFNKICNPSTSLCTQCLATSDCPTNQVCRSDNTCGPCLSNSNCPLGQDCNLSTGRCGCQTNGDCPQGAMCSNSACVPNYCDSSTPCPGGYMCKIEVNACVPYGRQTQIKPMITAPISKGTEAPKAPSTPQTTNTTPPVAKEIPQQPQSAPQPKATSPQGKMAAPEKTAPLKK
jgi:hypothetical protein